MTESTFLDKILKRKQQEIEERKSRIPLAELSKRVHDSPPPKDFSESIRRRRKTDSVRVIAEIKRASPSKGVLWSAGPWDPVSIARRYEENGAAAISILTDRHFFKGSLDDLRNVREVTALPLLRKDFIIDPYQIYEARAAGADAVLLIVAALETEQIRTLLALAGSLKIDCLIEVHEAEELERISEIEYRVVGINNRNLKDFTVDIGQTERLLPMVPPGRIIVSESGISQRRSIESLALLGVDAVLMGEALIRSNDIEAMLQELTRR